MKVLFIFAHPDDETFGPGGTIAKLINHGDEVSVITATDGQAGMTGEYGNISPQELGKIRRKEQSEAAKILRIPENKTTHLGMMDGTLADKSEDELISQIKPLIEKENPDVVITFEKNGISNHPDHKMISKVATKAFKEWMKNVEKHVRLYHIGVPKSYMEVYEKNGLSNKAFGETPGVPDENFTTTIDTTDVFEIKDKAARAHATQKSDWDRISKRMNHVDLKKEFYQLIAENSF